MRPVDAIYVRMRGLLSELGTVDERKCQDILNAVGADDSSHGKVKGHIAAETLLRQDTRHFLLLPECTIDQKLFGMKAAGKADQPDGGGPAGAVRNPAAGG